MKSSASYLRLCCLRVCTFRQRKLCNGSELSRFIHWPFLAELRKPHSSLRCAQLMEGSVSSLIFWCLFSYFHDLQDCLSVVFDYISGNPEFVLPTMFMKGWGRLPFLKVLEGDGHQSCGSGVRFTSSDFWNLVNLCSFIHQANSMQTEHRVF